MADCRRYDKFCAAAVSLKREKRTENTIAPSRLRVALRISWIGGDTGGRRSISARASEYTSSLQPRAVSGAPSTVARGDPISGIIEGPNSERTIPNLAASLPQYDIPPYHPLLSILHTRLDMSTYISLYLVPL